MTAQVGIQGKSRDRSGTFTKALIISSSNNELTESISIPTIPHPVWRLLRDIESDKQKFTNILSVEDYIMAEYRQG